MNRPIISTRGNLSLPHASKSLKNSSSCSVVNCCMLLHQALKYLVEATQLKCKTAIDIYQAGALTISCQSVTMPSAFVHLRQLSSVVFSKRRIRMACAPTTSMLWLANEQTRREAIQPRSISIAGRLFACCSCMLHA